MKALLRENLIVVISVALPIVVLAAFLAVALIPGRLVGPPAYDVVVSHGWTSGDFHAEVNVVDGRVRAHVTTITERAFGIVPRLYVFDSETRSLTEIEISIPADTSELQSGRELEIPQLADVRLDPSRRSPDGWQFERPASTPGGGLFTNVFGGAPRRFDPRLVKEGAVVPIPLESNFYDSTGRLDSRFLGWIVE